MTKRYFGLVALVLLVAGCDGGTTNQDRIDVADVNARNALAKLEELSSRVQELEDKVDELESRPAEHQGGVG